MWIAAFSGSASSWNIGKVFLFSVLVQHYSALMVDSVPSQSTWWRC